MSRFHKHFFFFLSLLHLRNPFTLVLFATGYTNAWKQSVRILCRDKTTLTPSVVQMSRVVILHMNQEFNSM